MESANKTKNKQKMILVGGLASFVFILVLGMYLSDPNRNKPDRRTVAQEKANEVSKDFTARSSNTVSAEESWIARSEQRLTSMERKNAELERKYEEALRTIDDLKSKKKPSLPPVPSPDQVSTRLSPNPLFPAAPMTQPAQEQSVANTAIKNLSSKVLPPPVPMQGQKGGKEITGIIEIDLSDEKTELDNKHYSHYMPSGSFATGVLLQGVDAPTGGLASTNPVPILLRLLDFGQLPNFFDLDIRNCHVTGDAYGDISSERVYVRLEKLSCILDDGTIIEEKVKGHVAGEDGKNGLRGTLVSKQGSILAKAALAGLASGIGDSINSQYQDISTSALGTVTSVDPDKALQAGLATGFSNSLERIADFYIARANETYPIIEVGSKRIVEIILSDGIDFGMDIKDRTNQVN